MNYDVWDVTVIQISHCIKCGAVLSLYILHANFPSVLLLIPEIVSNFLEYTLSFLEYTLGWVSTTSIVGSATSLSTLIGLSVGRMVGPTTVSHYFLNGREVTLPCTCRMDLLIPGTQVLHAANPSYLELGLYVLISCESLIRGSPPAAAGAAKAGGCCSWSVSRRCWPPLFPESSRKLPQIIDTYFLL